MMSKECNDLSKFYLKIINFFYFQFLNIVLNIYLHNNLMGIVLYNTFFNFFWFHISNSDHILLSKVFFYKLDKDDFMDNVHNKNYFCYKQV